MQKHTPWIDNPVLFRAVLRDSYDKFVEKLYSYNSILNTPNVNGETLLHYACFLGMVDKYDALVNFDAKIEKTQEGNTLLHYSAFSGYDNFLVTELVKTGFSPIDKNNSGQTSIHFSGNDWICQYFSVWALNNECNINTLVDNNGNTVAHFAKAQGKIDSYKYWIRNYPELLSIKNNDDFTPDEILTSKNLKFCTLLEL